MESDSNTAGWEIMSLQNMLIKDDNSEHQCGQLCKMFLINHPPIILSKDFIFYFFEWFLSFSGWKHVHYTLGCIIISVTSVLSTCIYRLSHAELISSGRIFINTKKISFFLSFYYSNLRFSAVWYLFYPLLLCKKSVIELIGGRLFSEGICGILWAA